MPRKKKPAKELTTDEAIRRLFPAKVIREANQAAHEHDDDNGKASKKQKKRK